MSEVAHRVMGREEAERLTERIRHAAASFVEAKEKLTRFIGEAQEGRAPSVRRNHDRDGDRASRG